MRISYISPAYYPRIGSMEYMVRSVAERLAKAGHEVSVLAGEPGIGKPVEEEVNGVKVLRWLTWAPGGAYHMPRRHGRLVSALRELLRVRPARVPHRYGPFELHHRLGIAPYY